MKTIKILLGLIVLSLVFISQSVTAMDFSSVRISKFNWPDKLTSIQHCSEHGSDEDYFAGHASVVYFYMGDSYETTLIQELMNLSKGFHGYDYKVLFYDTDATSSSMVSSSKAINQADEIHDPTKENFFSVLKDLFDRGYIVDIYITSHGNETYDGDAYFKAMDGKIYGSEIEEEFGSWGCGEAPIRMVWSGACYHSAMNDYWINAGAKVTSGARYINFYPNQYGRFAYKWTRGKSFKDAIDLSNTSAIRTAAQVYVYFLGLEYARQGDCGWWPNVLGENDCAEWFFTKGGPYPLDEDYISSRSGKSNMNHSSEKMIDGKKSIDNESVLYWTMPD